MSARTRTRSTPPSLEDRLHEAEPLALTWFELQLRRNIPPPAFDEHGWAVEHERVHGVRHYDERLELLRAALARAAADGVDIDRVTAILRGAKLAQLRQSQADAQLDWSRPRAALIRRIQRKLDAAADLVRELHRDFNPDNLPKTTELFQSLERRIRDALADHLITQHYREGRFRRPRAGRQPHPWVKRARQELTTVGVRRDVRENLLEAVGLIPLSAFAATLIFSF